jgi:hypothetical protein
MDHPASSNIAGSILPADHLLDRLTTHCRVVIITSMKAHLLLKERRNLDDDAFTELVVWEVSTFVPGSAHGYKYRLALVVNGICVLRCDNEAGKGDHRHIGDGRNQSSARA